MVGDNDLDPILTRVNVYDLDPFWLHKKSGELAVLFVTGNADVQNYMTE